MPQQFSLLFSAYLLSGLFLTACQSPQSTTSAAIDSSYVEVRDFEQSLVKLQHTANRIICLFEPMLDELYMLGVGDKVIGVPVEILSDMDYYRDYAKLDARIRARTMATPGSESVVDVEQIVALRPDLVILESSQSHVAKKIRSLGIAVYLCRSQEYEEIVQELSGVAKLTGTAARADTLLTALKAELAYMAKQNPTKTRKRAYFTWAYGKIFATIGKQSMMNSCLRLAGVENVCKAPLYRVDISPETLISWNPDLIITWNDSASKFYNRQEFHRIKAIQNRAVHNLLPMFFYNPHNIKAICTALRINSAAYGNAQVNQARITAFLRLIYGAQLAAKLLG